MYSVRISLLTLLASSVIVLAACEIENADTQPDGPDGSWWLGGADGGVYLRISDDDNTQDRQFTGVIYYEGDQSVWYEGDFVLEGDLKFDANDREQYLFWDGERIHLKDASSLVATGLQD